MDFAIPLSNLTFFISSLYDVSVKFVVALICGKFLFGVLIEIVVLSAVDHWNSACFMSRAGIRKDAASTPLYQRPRETTFLLAALITTQMFGIKSG